MKRRTTRTKRTDKLCTYTTLFRSLRANPDQRDVKNPDRALRDRRLKGLVVLQGFEGGPKEWKGGPVYDPETGEGAAKATLTLRADGKLERSEEHTSELQSLIRISYAVFCLTTKIPLIHFCFF